MAAATLTARSLFARSLFRTGIAGWRRHFSSYPPHQVVGLPSLSPTMESGSISAWTVKEGDSFAAGDVFCTVETDKASVDFEAQDDGVVAKILEAAGGGEDLKVGHPIMVTVEEEGDVAAFADFTVEAAPAAEAPPAETSAPPPATPAAPAATPPPAPAAPATDSTKVFASPLAHMLAKELGYDIASIPGTGPGGRIIAADVKEYVPTAAAAAAATETPAFTTTSTQTPIPGAGYTDYPLTVDAQELAARLVQSKRNVPHYYLTVDVNCDELLKLRKSISSSTGDAPDIGVFEFLLKAAAASMKTVPTVNASWMGDVVRVYDAVDINVPIGSGDELYTAVLNDCARMGLRAIGEELQRAVEEPDSSSAGGLGTFTVLNLGMYGIKSCAPIIREPQSCALAIGALENRIVPNSDPDSEEIYQESVVFTATLSCDHRVVDGAVGAQWLAAFKSYVEKPSSLLL